MLLNDVDDLTVEPMFDRQVHAFLHVCHDDQSAHRRSEISMCVSSMPHIFDEVLRLHQLPNVVKIRTNSGHRSVGPDGFGRSLSQLRDHQAVVVSAWSVQGHALEQGMI